MSKNTNNSITTIEQAIQILAYNEHFWQGFQTHPMDRKTVISLADSPYSWTEKQGRLALALLKRYHTLFKKYHIDLSDLLKNPVYKESFRVIDYVKSVEYYQHEDGRELIEIKFPYNEKLILLIRCLKNKKASGLIPMMYDGESKKWTIQYTELTCYYIALIAMRYNFKIVTPKILEDFQEIKKVKLSYRPAVIKLKQNHIFIENANEDLAEWWNNNFKNKKLLHQFDVLKNLHIPSVIRILKSEHVTLAEKIATSMHTDLWVDRTKYSRVDFLRALEELDMFPALVPLSGMLETFKDVEEFEQWYQAFKDLGYSNKQITWSLTLEEAPAIDVDEHKGESEFGYTKVTSDHIYGKETPVEIRKLMQDRWHDMVLESTDSKHIDKNTKLVIMRTKIPRTLMKSGIKLRCGFLLQDTQYWPTNTKTVSRMVDNLPKRLYYVSGKPGFSETNIIQI